ncbi:MAG: hypothetical protein KKA19_09045 [Candidatus Margulisbacteria bacterium]|nr:hypothetical protein [Candidatus Margulisiibacteriota bacterium]
MTDTLKNLERSINSFSSIPLGLEKAGFRDAIKAVIDLEEEKLFIEAELERKVFEVKIEELKDRHNRINSMKEQMNIKINYIKEMATWGKSTSQN